VVHDESGILQGPFDGWNTALWITSAAPTITNCFISRATYGIRIDGNSTPTIDFCDFNNLGAAPYVMSVLSDPTIGLNSVYSTNVYNAIALLSETLSQNARIKYRPGVGVPTFAYLPTGTIQAESTILEVARRLFGQANLQALLEREFPLPDVVAKSRAVAQMMKDGVLDLRARGSRLLWSLRIWRVVNPDPGALPPRSAVV